MGPFQDRGVIAAASDLFERRHYPGVLALCNDALAAEPGSIPLLLIRARALIALRRDLDAQTDLRDIIGLDPRCGPAYRLLGELAARRSENESAAVFFREALRLDPGDREALERLLIVESPARPTATRPAPVENSATARAWRSEPDLRFARGTNPPDDQDERPTKPFTGRGSSRDGAAWKTAATPMPAARPVVSMSPPPPPIPRNKPANQKFTINGCGPTQMPAKPAKPSASRPISRAPIPELPGFGDYLVSSGVLTRDRLRAAQAYQRSMKVQLSTAIVTLGLATPQRIEWASVAHQSQLARDRPQQP